MAKFQTKKTHPPNIALISQIIFRLSFLKKLRLNIANVTVLTAS